MADPIDNPKAQAEPTISPDATHISSPASTGGAGNVFEQHVDAYWLAQLLVGGIAPILIDSAIVEVHFQAEHLGWRTDDVLVVGQNGSGQIRKLICQVKRTFTISAIDEECKQAIRDFWADFTNINRFASGDCFALITQRGTNTLLGHFGGLLDCAHAACDASDFEHRLATPGLVSNKLIQYCGDLRTIIGEVEGKDFSAGDIWTFLRVLHVLSLDLATPTRQHEATIKSLLAYTAIDSKQIETAANSWNALLALAGTAMGSAATFRRENLPQELQQKHGAGVTGQGILPALRDHSTIILEGIRSTIGTGPHLARSTLVQEVIGKLGESQVVLLSGTAGTGKSAVAKDAISALAGAYFTFAFRAEEFAQPHFDATLHNGQISGNTTALSSVLGGQDRKVSAHRERWSGHYVKTAAADREASTAVANYAALRLTHSPFQISSDSPSSIRWAPASFRNSLLPQASGSDTTQASGSNVPKQPNWARRHALLLSGLAMTGAGTALVATGGDSQASGCLPAGINGAVECTTVPTWGSGRHIGGVLLLIAGAPVTV